MISGKSRIYRKSESPQGAEPIEFPTSFSASGSTEPETRLDAKPTASLQALADQLILHHYAPPAVIVNDKGDILYISGHTGKYLEPAAGKANWNLFAMVREGLRYEVADAFQKAIRKREIVSLHGLKVGTNGGSQFVDVTIRRLEEPEALQGLIMIVFTDVPPPGPIKASGKVPSPHVRNVRTADLEQELLRARAEARATHEEMQTSQEELRSTNEELQSTNEELQSTNEELTTSREEMQSLNEELQTVNTELQSKVDDFARTRSWRTTRARSCGNGPRLRSRFARREAGGSPFASCPTAPWTIGSTEWSLPSRKSPRPRRWRRSCAGCPEVNECLSPALPCSGRGRAKGRSSQWTVNRSEIRNARRHLRHSRSP